MTDIQVDVGPLVQVVFPNEDERIFPFSDLAFETDDPATISDPDLMARVARHLDREVEDFADMMVSRPRTGNILISEKPIFGARGEAERLGRRYGLDAATIDAVELSLKAFYEIGHKAGKDSGFSYADNELGRCGWCGADYG